MTILFIYRVKKTTFILTIHFNTIRSLFYGNHSTKGTRLLKTIEQYKTKLGYYPKEVLVDKIFCTRENRAKLKGLGVVLIAKPLGRPKAVQNHIRPGERNPMEGKFGQAKTAYGMNRIKAKLEQTSESWIATIIMVLNLVKFSGHVPYCLAMKILTYSAWCLNLLNQESKKWMQQMEKNFSIKRKGLLIQQTLITPYMGKNLALNCSSL